MAKRMNVILQDATFQLVRRVVKAGERSRYIDQAVQYYAATRSPEAIREGLKSAALRDRDIMEEVGRDWSAVDLEAWHTTQNKRSASRRTRGAAKSIS